VAICNMWLLRFYVPRTEVFSQFVFTSYTCHAFSCITPCTFGWVVNDRAGTDDNPLVGLAGFSVYLLMNVCSSLCSKILVFQVALFFALIVAQDCARTVVCVATSIDNLDLAFRLAMLRVSCFDPCVARDRGNVKSFVF
jgi:hypothetical protein